MDVSSLLSGITSFWQPLEQFVGHLESEVNVRWRFWATDYRRRRVHEVVVGLLAHQATLASSLVMNPLTWNAQSAPLFLRPMVENWITITWILKDEGAWEARTEKFIQYGLGQENLLLEHCKADLYAQGKDPEDDSGIRHWEEWINAQRYSSLTEIDLGNWAGISLRKMAEEIGRVDLHSKDYALWSGATHGTWNHILKNNLRTCSNPLHGLHYLPSIPRPGIEIEFLFKAAKYVDGANHAFDTATGFKSDEPDASTILDGVSKRIIVELNDMNE